MRGLQRMRGAGGHLMTRRNANVTAACLRVHRLIMALELPYVFKLFLFRGLVPYADIRCNGSPARSCGAHHVGIQRQ